MVTNTMLNNNLQMFVKILCVSCTSGTYDLSLGLCRLPMIMGEADEKQEDGSAEYILMRIPFLPMS